MTGLNVQGRGLRASENVDRRGPFVTSSFANQLLARSSTFSPTCYSRYLQSIRRKLSRF